jgi:hypothetical protein
MLRQLTDAYARRPVRPADLDDHRRRDRVAAGATDAGRALLELISAERERVSPAA